MAHEAIAHLKAAISLDAEDALAYFNLGVVLHGAGAHLEAVEAYRSAIAKCPTCWEAYENLSACLGDLGQWGEAVTVLRLEETRRPSRDSALLYRNLGIALRATGQYNEAEATARRCITLTPDDPEAYVTLAGTLADRGRWAEAVPPAREVIRIKGGTASASDFFNLGVALAEIGELEEAKRALSESVDRDPEDVDARVRLGSLLADTEPERAMRILEPILLTRPDSPEAQCVQGAALLRLGRESEALKVFQRVELEAPHYFDRNPGMRDLYETARKAAK